MPSQHTTYSPLRELRRNAPMTQVELAAAMRAAGHRWHQTTVHRVERGLQDDPAALAAFRTAAREFGGPPA